MTVSIPPLASSHTARPVAPSQAVWDTLSAEARAEVVASLPSWVDIDEWGAMQGDEHRVASQRAEGTLQQHFAADDPSMYITAGMATYFPQQDRVVPDLMAVPGAGQAKRLTWVVSQEERKPAWVLEILVAGDREKDLRDHVVRYAELGIREYFIADLLQRRIYAYRLADPSIAVYTPTLAQRGRYRSEVLRLDLALEDGAVRFYDGDRRLLDPDEQVEALRDALNDEIILREDAEHMAANEVQARRDAERQAAEDARARTNAESARRDAERRAAEEALARQDAEQRAADEAKARADAEQRAADEAKARADAEQRAADEAKARRDAEQRAVDAATELARMRELLARLQRG